jgi:hypothetical protein
MTGRPFFLSRKDRRTEVARRVAMIRSRVALTPYLEYLIQIDTMQRRAAIATVSRSEPDSRQDPEARRRLSAPAIRSFFNLAGKWSLSVSQQRGLLGWPAASTYHKYKAGQVGSLSFDTLTRISLLLGIFKALHILYPQAELADQWIKLRNANPMFGRKSPLDVMIDGGIDGLFQVRRLLDARRGG